jgi:micrococcal nuclease
MKSLSLLLFLLFALPARAEVLQPPSSLQDGKAGKVSEVVDGDTVKLDDGRQVRLVGTQAPKRPLGRPNFPAWPFGEESKRALEHLVLGKRVRLLYGGERKDRHGRELAHLARDGDGLWIQGELLRLGMTRIYTFPDNRAAVPQMLALERVAREAKTGIWGHAFYAIRRPDDLAKLIGTFQIAEGAVKTTAKGGDSVYLNFGEDWKTDFTVSIDKESAALFRMAKLDPLKLEGRLVRVRGWLHDKNGPMIDATHPEQIELLDGPPPGRSRKRR